VLAQGIVLVTLVLAFLHEQDKPKLSQFRENTGLDVGRL
jgi:hypothetical protein